MYFIKAVPPWLMGHLSTMDNMTANHIGWWHETHSVEVCHFSPN